ncbi:short-chain dehydrogenase [bacterium]|nr:short-chain dehydrogenase [bacterium]
MPPTLSGQTVVVLGGFGLVGRAVCYELLKENPKRIVVCSLRESESAEAVADLAGEVARLNETGRRKIRTKIIGEHGDIFLRESLKDRDMRAITDPADLDRIIADTFDDPGIARLDENFLYRIVARYKPQIVIDAVNTATGVAYRDVYATVLDLRLRMRRVETMSPVDPAYGDEVRGLVDSLRLHLTSIYLPRLVRHVQVLYTAMKAAGTRAYCKIGTTGTGGMGLNIPYTHSEERPSQKLLSKSAVAGAHSLLLFLMNSTPGFAFTMEVKPAAAIAWKAIDHGPVARGGEPIALFDADPARPFDVSKSIDIRVANDERISSLGRPLRAVFINTGENGLFSSSEFEAITTTGQMEYVTPEEIAQAVKEELTGANTGYDIIGMLSNTVMKSTYRAGVMREHALEELRELELKHGAGIAFEILGPPRLSKLLFEAETLRRTFGTLSAIAKADPARMSARLADLVKKDAELRSRVVSIGIPILLPDGVSLLRGPRVAIPAWRGADRVRLTAATRDRCAHDGWVDLRETNMRLWIARAKGLTAEIATGKESRRGSDIATSSRTHRKRYEVTRDGKREMNIGEIVGWIFNEEEEGSRKTYAHPRANISRP